MKVTLAFLMNDSLFFTYIHVSKKDLKIYRIYDEITTFLSSHLDYYVWFRLPY